MTSRKLSIPNLSLVATLAVSSFSYAADENDAANEAAKELANPNTAFASLNFKPAITSFENENGEDFEQNTLLFQPVLPFPREDGSKIIVRPAITYMEDDGFGNSGMLDLSSDVFYAFAAEPGVLEGVGAIFSLPTGSEDIGQGEVTSIGASYIYGNLTPENIWLFFPSHLQSIDEGDNGSAVSLTTLQLTYVLLPGGGWNYGTSNKIKYNWEAESGEEWTVPINIVAGKTVVLDGRPWKFSVEFDYFVVSPDPVGPEYALTFTITPVVENVMTNWF